MIGHRVPFFAARGAGTDANAFFRGKRRGVHKRPARLRVESVGPLLAIGPGHFAERLSVNEMRRSRD